MNQIAGVGSPDPEFAADSVEEPSLGGPVGSAAPSSAATEPFRWTVIRGNADAATRRAPELDSGPGQLQIDRPDSAAPIRLRRWNRREYDRLTDLGVLQPGERMEQLGGETVLRDRQGDQHALAIELVDDALHAALGTGWRVRVRLPVMLDDDSEPEPDFSVLQGNPRDGGRPVQSRLSLVIEVADSTLAFDRSEKGSLYARAAVPDYWIVNLKDRALEVYREPLPATEAPFGWRYNSVRSLGPGAVISPLAAPRARVVVAYLLP